MESRVVSSQKQPRRSPRQDRSRDTVAAILEATAQILRVRGLAHTTTRSIALRAGVSVGSLYQYFPSKESVIRALAQHRRDELIATLHETLARTAGYGLEDRARALVSALLEAKSRDPQLDTKLSAAMLEIDGPCYLDQDAEPFRRLVEQALEQIDFRGNRVLTAFVIVGALSGVFVGSASAEHRANSGELAQAVTRLVLGYLTVPEPEHVAVLRAEHGNGHDVAG